MMISRVLRYCCLAVAACFGSFAYAATDPVHYGHTLRHIVADLGAYGASTADFAVKQAYMAEAERTGQSRVVGLMKDSHDYLQASADEVAQGTTGSTVSLFLS
jgi:hypothetical protein